MFKKSLLALTIATASLSLPLAYAYEFDKPMQISIPVTKSAHGLRAGIDTTEVTIMRVKLTPTEQEAIKHRQIHTSLAHPNLKLPTRLDLGMNGVPVLNQGRHGSCVTFAQTGAVDALLGKGDYISQLCNLELGLFLEKYSYLPSGWSGSLGPIVLDQMMHFGVINKENQRTKSCANVTEYPVFDAQNVGNEMSLAEFRPMVEDLNTKLYWTHLFSNDQLFDWKTAEPEQMEKLLQDVKENLFKGHRVTFGTFLIIVPNCRAGACAAHHTAGDTWALTKEIETPPYDVGGHEMIIIGYDDKAVAYDQNGKQHVGLLTLRNSWSELAGDNGNYYMTYDFFKKYANEAQAIVEIK